jgi:hypothetical protein
MGEQGVPVGVIAEAVAATREVLRLEGSAEDALLGRVCAAAILLCEAFVGGAIVARVAGDGAAETWDAVPAPVAQGVAMLAAHLFDHRESDALPPAAVAALWRPYRRMRLSPEVAA